MPDDEDANGAWPDLLFWLGHPADVGTRVELEPDESHHLLKVTRHRVGAYVSLADGAGGWLSGEIIEVRDGRAEIEIAGRRESPADPPFELHLAFPPLRPARTELILEKGTELGVTRFTPLVTARTRPAQPRPERWRRLVRGAAMQCLRSAPPVLEPAMELSSWLSSLPEGPARWVGRPGGEARPAGERGDAIALVGPEGDLGEEEWGEVLTAGFRPVDLGPRRLRAETAALALIVAVSGSSGSSPCR